MKGKTLLQEEILSYCEALPKYKRPRKVFLYGQVSAPHELDELVELINVELGR